MIPNKQKPEEIIGIVVTIGMVIVMLVVMPMVIIDVQNNPPPTKACNCIPPMQFLSVIGAGLLITIIIAIIPKMVKIL